MLAQKFSIRDDFPPVDYAAWRAAAERALGHSSLAKAVVTTTFEGFDLQPIYTRSDVARGEDPTGFPGRPPYVRGASAMGATLNGWDIRQQHAHPDVKTTNEAILDDLEGGVTSLQLRFDRAARAGLDPADAAAAELVGRDGIGLYGVEDMDAALAGVDLAKVGVALDAGAAFLPAAAALAALWRRRDLSHDAARGALNADPVGVLAREGQLPVSMSTAVGHLSAVACWTDAHCPNVTAVGVNTSVYHESGATASQDIAFGLATAVEYLRAMNGAGLTTAQAARQILFQMVVDTQHFMSIAKLRAARQLWSRILQVCTGESRSSPMRIHALTSHRVLTARAPYINLLRNTAGVFAAAVGGAEIITSVPFDAVWGPPNKFSRRLARNTALILQEEAQLHKVIDPAGGCWYLEKLTSLLAVQAWNFFQDIERQGGMTNAVRNGWIAGQVDSAFARHAKKIALREPRIAGVDDLADDRFEEKMDRPEIPAGSSRHTASRHVTATRQARKLVKEWAASPVRMEVAIEAAAQGVSCGQMARAGKFHNDAPATAPALKPRRFAQPFEQLRDEGIQP